MKVVIWIQKKFEIAQTFKEIFKLLKKLRIQIKFNQENKINIF